MAMVVLANLILLLLISSAEAFRSSVSPQPLLPASVAFSAASNTNEADCDAEIIIIGGGLVGMATGVALSERGVSSCQIYEQAQELRQVGAAIGLYPNGLSALQYISPAILELVRSTSSPCQVFERRDLNDDLVQATNVPTIKATAPVMYAWFLLQQHFGEALPMGCVQLGHAFESYKVLDNGMVQVSLQDNNNSTITKTCRLLIGADGIHSKVRQQLVGSPTTIAYYGKVMYRAVLDKEQVDGIVKIPEGTQISWQGTEKGKSFSLRETTQGIVTVTAAALADQTDNNNNNKLTKKERLQKLFQEFPDPVQQIIRALPNSIHEDFIRDVNIPNDWSEGPVVILGDAAHAMTPHMGQGANQGLEDVCELVERIIYDQPLSGFVRARLPRVTEIQAHSRQNTVQSNTFDKQTASIPFQRRQYSEDFKDRLYNWMPPSLSGRKTPK